MGSATTDRRMGLTGDKGMKAPVDLATTTSITLSGEQTIDGALTSTSRVMVKNQSDSTQNGIYDSSTGTWTRTADADGIQDVVNGTMFYVSGGATQSGRFYVLSGTNPVLPGSSAITFSPVIYGTTVVNAYTATAGQTAFTLSSAPGSVNNTIVTIDGIRLTPTMDYTLSGTTLTIPSGVALGYEVLVSYQTVLAQGTSDAASASYLPSGTGATTTSVQAKLRESVSVLDFGAVGDGVTDDTAAFAAALTAASGKELFVPTPNVSYLINTGLTVPANTTIRGANKRTCKIQAGGNINLITLNGGAALHNLYLEGNAKTGYGVLVPSAAGDQTVQNCRIINFNPGTGGGVLHFADNTAGSRFYSADCEIWQTGGSTGTNLYAVYVPDVLSASAVPKTFIGLQTSGFCSFFLGGCNDLFVLGSFIGDLKFSTNTRSVSITATRVANQTALTVKGANITLVGGDWLPQITIDPALTNSVIGPFSNNTMPTIDNVNTTASLVQVFQGQQSYTPTISSGGTAPVLGNGTLVGSYSRDGASITATIGFTVGSTTTLGTGGLSFSLPLTSWQSDIQECCVAVLNHSGTIYTAVGQIAGGGSAVSLLRDTTGSVTFNSPATWAAGDTMRMTLTYYR